MIQNIYLRATETLKNVLCTRCLLHNKCINKRIQNDFSRDYVGFI